MAKSNLAFVREMLDAWDRDDLDAYFAALTEDVFLRPPENWPEAEVFRGKPAVEGAMRDLHRSLPEMTTTVHEFAETEHAVIGRYEQQVRGRSSGIETTGRSYVFVTRIRDGMCCGIGHCLDWDAAFEAASRPASEAVQ